MWTFHMEKVLKICPWLPLKRCPKRNKSPPDFISAPLILSGSNSMQQSLLNTLEHHTVKSTPLSSAYDVRSCLHHSHSFYMSSRQSYLCSKEGLSYVLNTSGITTQPGNSQMMTLTCVERPRNWRSINVYNLKQNWRSITLQLGKYNLSCPWKKVIIIAMFHSSLPTCKLPSQQNGSSVSILTSTQSQQTEG